MDAKDILNNTDPAELRNILRRLKVTQDAGLRAVPGIIISEAPGQFPGLPAFDANCIVFTDNGGHLAVDGRLKYISLEGLTLGSQVATGTVAGNNESGVEITGLTVGNWYAIEAANGPWFAGGGGTLESYEYELSLDGVTWSGTIGKDFNLGFVLIIPDWADSAEAVDEFYGRVYWQATTTSVWIRCDDSPGFFGSNTGSLDYIVSNANFDVTQIELDEVEYVLLKLPGAIHGATEKTTPVNADEFAIWDSVSGLLNKATWANIKATLKTYFDTLYAAIADYLTDAPSDGNIYGRKDGDWEIVEVQGKYRQFAWVDDGSGGWEFISSGSQPVLHLTDME